MTKFKLCIFTALVVASALLLQRSHASDLVSFSIRGPGAVEEFKSIRLHCHFTAEERREESIHSVVWYWTPAVAPSEHHHEEKIPFYRFLQHDDPNAERKRVWAEKLKGAFTVGVMGSTSTSVYLDQMSLRSEGVFSCEICFFPDFSTFTTSKHVRVGRVPTGTPVITVNNKQKRYQEGDTLDLNCSSIGGFPSPNITWFINSEKLDSYNLKSKQFTNTNQNGPDEDVEPETFSLVTVPVQANVMTGSGNVKVKCVASQWSLYHKSNEISVEIVGLDPNPKSIRHSDSKLESRNEEVVVEVYRGLENRAGSGVRLDGNVFVSAVFLYLASKLVS